MTKLERPESPPFLKDKWQKWGEKFKKNKVKNSNFPFQWATYKKQKVNLLLLPLLKEDMNKSHCTYCDGFPIRSLSKETIDHFRPKSQFPELAYQWENLFLCCDRCQSEKLENFDNNLLKPDEKEYEFDTYFAINFKTGELIPNPFASVENQEKANITIAMLNLKEEDICIARLKSYATYQYDLTQEKPIDINKYAYRFMLF
ncbi:MAG: HNH endonuclease [Thermoflexibacter sp.]|jgi:uncharacterized protein (TIGR02646 family)|nr:HNH endonuclease [Thermoflexibacter sp.]